ncbi:MAG: stalk domain-containing protein [Candidatus Pristimantibacillus lignocellulolyticus]|uniref:Stalk domain-containing protein n=1 Tax=Candidatus Pristimantibacillus lignocellulolyticus TaxID=2994561 RepID=A0A9J6ZG04_9BACL|nr:MAG: stalk domain-containing protein [Candidatus Pristimantibacillus lignocellulolyticus]
MKRQSLKKYIIITSVCAMAVAAPFIVQASSVLNSKKGLLEVRTMVGQSKSDFNDGSRSEASLFYPTSLLQQHDGSLLISDTKNHKIRVLANDYLTTLSGHIVDFDESSLPIGSFGDGAVDVALYQSPGGLALDAQGQIYIADTNNHSIRRISNEGVVTTIAGSWAPGDQDGVGSEAGFYYPSDVAVDSKGNIYVADTLNHLIRKIDKDGKVTTLNKASERVVEYVPGVLEFSGSFADGPLSKSMFNEPTGLAIDAKDNLYVSDKGNQRIRYIDFSNNTVSTVAGNGTYGSNELYVEGDYVDGAVSVARLSSPSGITITQSGVILVADTLNHVIRAIHNGNVTTVAGIGGEYGFADGVLSSAALNEPTDVIELDNGDIAIADSSNNRIRVVQSYVIPESVEQDGEIHIIVNDELLETDVAPIMQQNRTYVPLRAIVTKLGLQVNYLSATDQYEVIVNENLSYTFSATSNIMKIIDHGVSSELLMDSPAIVKENRVLMPVRFFAEQLGYNVEWDQANNNVVIRQLIFN